MKSGPIGNAERQEHKLLLESYVRKAGSALLETMLVFDYAVTTEKMMDWSSVGIENEAWRKGPFLSAGANRPEIDRTAPYCLKMSDESRMTAYLLLGENPIREENGGVRLPVTNVPKGTWASEAIISKLAIIEQFEIYKDYAQSVGGPFSKKSADAWRERVDANVLDALQRLTGRRNMLTHDREVERPNAKEAVEYFNSLRWVARQIVSWKLRHQ